MHLLSPLPSMTLPCPLTAFEVLLTEQKMNLKISDPVVPWLDARIRHFGLQLNHSEVASVPSHGFICDRESLLRLLQLEFFAISVSDEHQNEGTARLLGILAAHRLKSPPFRCNLDGCALQLPRHREVDVHLRVGEQHRDHRRFPSLGGDEEGGRAVVRSEVDLDPLLRE